MAQPAITNYFNTRKRTADADDHIHRAKKVLVLDTKSDAPSDPIKSKARDPREVVFVRSVQALAAKSKEPSKTPKRKQSGKKVKETSSLRIEELLSNMCKTNEADRVDAVIKERHVTPPTSPIKIYRPVDRVTPCKSDMQPRIARSSRLAELKASMARFNEGGRKLEQAEKLVTEAEKPSSAEKCEPKEMSLQEIQQKLCKSARLKELKASLARFREGERKLESAEKKTSSAESPTIKAFKTLDFEVVVSPQKDVPPGKQYLSPKKDASARKNLLNLLSPTKNAVALPSVDPLKEIVSSTKTSLTLPFKYRSLAEIFRGIDTVCQILYNRKETITFAKLKPAVEQMIKKTVTEKHLGQIKALYEDAFKFSQEKIKTFGTGSRDLTWQLVIVPNVESSSITSDILLERRRNLYNTLINKLKSYHNEFLLSLDPPMEIPPEKLTRWHPEFDIERVPDIEPVALPEHPEEAKVTSGKEVMERAKQLFSCSTHMEEALARLEKHKMEQTESGVEEKPIEMQSVLKGIPKALLEKVRQRQAAKTLLNLTRSSEKEQEVQMYLKLPEIARVTRSVFVSEKKGVLPLGVLTEKLENSYRAMMSSTEMQKHLRLIEKEVPGWLVFVDIRHNLYVKLDKKADVSLVITKLTEAAKSKAET